ncbi:cupin domain-containing protein [Flavivirga spongiicola]|uniref:Cupin domain-containing protein n=1 Tax=Flavivirga spongiicola TaxID=421621 RepID=A0ABU7XPU5_9FLAO|nr:cupin domain-containing protein [Flavivirga sp. MEBiC05379]MDO5977795.1 cupin domain-containing protein [Flavivirga sp. MEBiC05379]
MAINIYEPCTNSITGETFRTISFNKEALVMQWTVQPKGHVPLEHIHLNQDEVFHVKQGEIELFMGGKTRIAKEGESITVLAGVAHVASNNKDTVLDCLVEYRPGLDHNVFMQCFMGLMHDDLLDKKGIINIPRIGYFMTRMKAKCLACPNNIPPFVFTLALKVFYLIGVLNGWNKLYHKYTGL